MATIISPPPASNASLSRPSSAVHRPAASMTSPKFERSSRSSDEDTKTSVKVALKPSDPGFDLIPQRFQRSMVQDTSASSLAVDSPQGRKLFIFDRVFGGEVMQDGIFDYIQPGVDAFLQGYNVSIMAYGQSGAGKSFTMGTSGPSEQNDGQLMGIVPRAAMALFARLSGPPPSPTRAAAAAAGSGLKAPARYSMSLGPGALNGKVGGEREWQLKATYLEIYNEQLRDLLIPNDTPVDMRPVPTIREDKGKILLTNLTQVDINSTDDLMNALNHGSTIRQTDATAINARSSRSHAIFSLNLVQKRSRGVGDVPAGHSRHASMPADVLQDSSVVVVTDSKLHFVDLAGSERLKNTGASGDRAKEGIAINAGLASLGKVISQLSSRSAGAHVSYRDSKLTRILQDSLGGNAITYLVACVTPAEFHLSETLNTVQYAQRARAIQSKPQIQQISDGGDKQGLIDRLNAEVAFLRDQVKSAQRLSMAANGTLPGDRSDEREAELREHLHAAQESYSALSRRHANLIAEISKAGSDAGAGAAGATPAERIERAHNMNKIIDQVVSEYESTISALQEQLGVQKATLDSNEKRILEQESKAIYVEKVNTQLQTRAQKLVDREVSLESYARDLEARLDGRNSSDGRQAELVADLRKQLNTLRDNEAASEDYIAQIEERLAEAEQDMELMNREINRLENIVERQRSVGRLDSLMMELNNIQKKGEAAAATEMLVRNGNGHATVPATADEATHELATKTPVPESDGTDLSRSAAASDDRLDLPADSAEVNGEQGAVSPTPMQFLEEKLDSVNSELVALRVEHEGTCSEYNTLADKYHEALRALAAMQRAADRDEETTIESRNNTTKNGGSFAGDATALRGTSDLSSITASPTGNDESDQLTEIADSEAHIRSTPATSISSSQFRPLSDISENGASVRPLSNQIVLAKEFDRLKALNAQKDTHVSQLSNELDEMKTEYERAMETISSLRSDVQRAKAGSPASPTNFVRRKSGHNNVLGTDRSNRAFVTLTNISTDHLDDKPDVRENFQIQINALMNEMAVRADRVDALETEVANAKKELEAKMQIISGLARERSSMIAASPVDVSVVSSMRDQLVQNENHIKALQEQLVSREEELGKEIRALKSALDDGDGEGDKLKDSTRDFMKRSSSRYSDHDLDDINGDGENSDLLRGQIQALRATEQQLLATISELESTLSTVDQLRQEKTMEADDHSRAAAAATAALGVERQKLTDELIQQKSTIETHAARFDALQSAYESLQRELNDHSGLSEASIAQLENHRAQIDQLEQHLQEQYGAIEEYRDTIEEMARTHARELEDMQLLIQQHDLESSSDIPEGEAGNYELRKRLEISETARSQTEAALREVQTKVETLAMLERQLKQENGALRGENDRSSRMLQDLEGQLQHSYEDTRRASQHEVAEARAAAVKLQQEISVLENRLQSFERSGTPSQPEFPERANSMASRKSIGLAALPSPPPAIPLPPLPYNAPQSPLPYNAPQSPLGDRFPGVDGRPKSPPSNLNAAANGGKRDSTTQATIQEQEARIRTVEKHLNAEKQLTQTLEEALVDLEQQGDKVKKEAESWKKRAQQIESELAAMKQERNASQRDSRQLMEDERMKRMEAEQARNRLEEKMAMLNKKKKKSTLNCF